MTLKEIQELVKMINRLQLSEFKMRDGEFELLVRTKHFESSEKRKGKGSVPVVVGAPAVPAAPVSAPVEPPPAKPAPAQEVKEEPAPKSEDSDEGLVPIKSPIVGTFYRSSAPDKPPFVKVGDVIEVGAVVCIVEAMKLFNEIESEVSGKIVKAVVEDASPVEYDQVLFMVDPKG